MPQSPTSSKQWQWLLATFVDAWRLLLYRAPGPHVQACEQEPPQSGVLRFWALGQLCGAYGIWSQALLEAEIFLDC